jgi:hypothetical protein
MSITYKVKNCTNIGLCDDYCKISTNLAFDGFRTAGHKIFIII